MESYKEHFKATKKADKKVEEGLINSLIGKSVSYSSKEYKRGRHHIPAKVYFCEVKSVDVQPYIILGSGQGEMKTWVIHIVEKDSEDKTHPFTMQIQLGNQVPLNLAFIEIAMKKYNVVLGKNKNSKKSW